MPDDAARYRWLRDTFHTAKGGAHLAVNDVLAYYETPRHSSSRELPPFPPLRGGGCVELECLAAKITARLPSDPAM